MFVKLSPGPGLAAGDGHALNKLLNSDEKLEGWSILALT